MSYEHSPVGGSSLFALDDRTRVRIGRSLAGLSVVLGVTGTVALTIMGRWDFLVEGFIVNNGVLGVGLGALVWVVLAAQPRNGAVWALAWSGVFGAILAASTAIGILLAPTSASDFTLATFEALSPSELSWAAAIAFWPFQWMWIPAFFLLLPLGILLFPDGRLLTRRWRKVGWLSVATIATGSLATAWLFHPSSTLALTDEPSGVAVFVGDQAYLLLFVLSVLSVASLVLRYRRSPSEARRQIRMIALGALVFVSATIGGLIVELSTSGSDTHLGPLLLLAGEVVFVVSFAIGILKYRLYNLEVVISKTVTYLALAAFIAAVYVGLVVGVSELVGGRSSFALSIAATVLIAFAFQPVRRIVQRAANRLVYGERATPYEVLARFSHGAAEASDEELVARVPRLIVDGTSASEATLWVRTERGFREGASWPEKHEARVITVAGDTFTDPDADYSLPVLHDDELLGGLSLVTSRGETITPPEQALLSDLAAGLGLSLRNARLTSQLREQVAELEASRERVLAAADTARRALENDLDSGPQQQLVALKVKLGPTRKRAEQLGAEKTASLLTQLENDAGDAIKAVRDFAGGIYPPLLEAEGLALAIAQQAHKAAIPITVDGNGVRQYRRETEAAVYFTVLEALQNTAKYADATSASVSLTANGNRLLFEVRDDGRGFDPKSIEAGAGLAGMTDRLDTVGGEVRIESAPGEGTVVTGSVPVGELVTA